ncbi:hypothetical protein [uncultured Micrococcus sp.]|uniref:hypothetical protein n=1 Tax=uncultured Micrococcus sp. TaxID=114051 RepID=UPI0025955BC0|nr:hypothetical protein [uncultured Micrococcus sp.]
MSPVALRLMDTLRPVLPATRPALLRLAVGGYAAARQFRRRRMFQRVHAQEPDRFAPVGPCRVLSRPLPPAVADAVFDLTQVVNVAATLGLAHRVTGPVNAALQIWTTAYRNSWGMVLHNDNMVVLHQAVLGCTRSADAWSVDALVRGRWHLRDVAARRYGAVPVAMNTASVAVYLICGVAKVRSELGLRWAGGDVLRGQIAVDGLRKDLFGSSKQDLGVTLYSRRRLFTALAAGALVVELAAPAALVHPSIGRLFALGAWGMHGGIRAVMGIHFPYNTSGVAYLSFFVLGRRRLLHR